jgi:hypothetical protein
VWIWYKNENWVNPGTTHQNWFITIFLFSMSYLLHKDVSRRRWFDGLWRFGNVMFKHTFYQKRQQTRLKVLSGDINRG